MTDQDLRVRQLAYRIWESEGRPAGQEQRHWDMALKIVNAERESDPQQAPAPVDRASGEAPLEEPSGENASMDERGASDYAQPEPPTAPAQAPVSPGPKGDGVIAQAEKKARAAVKKATGAKPPKPKATRAKADKGTASRAPKTPKASSRKPKGSTD